MRNIRNLVIAGGIGLFLAGQTGCAQSAPQELPPEQDRFVVMDANGDGKVVIEEFRAAFPNMNENAFTVIDKNGDKGIDRVEWAEFTETHGRPPREPGAPMNNIPGDPLIPPVDSADLPLMRPPVIN